MRTLILSIATLALLIACKKKNTEDPITVDPNDGAYSNRVKSINNGSHTFKYNADGTLKSYSYNTSDTAKITYSATEIYCDEGIGYQFYRPRDAAGYALPGTQDLNSGKTWSYTADHKVAHLNGIDYYWSNGDIDSLIFQGTKTTFSYLSNLETRNYGAQFTPYLIHFPQYNLGVTHLKSNQVQYNLQGDTISYRTYSYQFDASGRVISETTTENITNPPTLFATNYYTYWD